MSANGRRRMQAPIRAPFTPEQQAALNASQADTETPVWTCPNDDQGVLVAGPHWSCPTCDYTQYWAHRFMAADVDDPPSKAKAAEPDPALYRQLLAVTSERDRLAAQLRRQQTGRDQPMSDVEITASERLARRFHERYEALAPAHGYKTREESAVPWEDVPAANKALMTAVAGDILRKGYTRTWTAAREDDEDFPPEFGVTVEDPMGRHWEQVADDDDGWYCVDGDHDEVFTWSAALDEVGSLREVVA